ncbi:MAG: hypothetical protein K2X65_06355 [Burkholderiaceae bacterium]|nr:hypothetical protein [Burkholderiaceae bacterium]
MMKIRSLSAWAVAAGMAVLTWGSATTAQASDVYWSLGVATPGVVVGVGNGYSVYTTPQPRYYPQPPSAYFAPPAPVYYAPQQPVYYAPPPVYYPPQGYRDYRGHGRHPHRRDYYDRGERGDSDRRGWSH